MRLVGEQGPCAADRRAVNQACCLIAGTLLALISTGCHLGWGDSEEADGWVEIRGKRIPVEIADTARAQEKGLGERDSLAWDRGMYFIYDQPAFYAFWMKGMRFSIDIIWLREGRIIDVDANVPFEKGGNGPTMRPSEMADAVLEVPAGYVHASRWQIGDRAVFERFKAK